MKNRVNFLYEMETFANSKLIKSMQIKFENVDICRSGASEASDGTTLNTETIKRFSDR